MLRIILSGAVLVAGLSSACVTIETGQTTEEVADTARAQASTIRSSWASRFEAAAPDQRPGLVVNLIEEVCRQLVEFGRRVSSEWKSGESGRGVDISAEEMRKVIDAWTKRDLPIFKAREDNIEYGADRLKESGLLRPQVIDWLDQLIGHYYDTYNAMFYPTETVAIYDDGLDSAEFDLEELLVQFRRELGER